MPALATLALALLAWALVAGAAEARLDPLGGTLPAPPRDDQRSRQQQAPERPAADSAVTNAAGEPLDVSSECGQNLRLAASNGLELPAGWKLYCVGPGLDWNGATHWGVTCPYDDCPEGSGPYVSISNPTYYVVAHELCHANFGNDELMADRCAAEHGASLATSPYS